MRFCQIFGRNPSFRNPALAELTNKTIEANRHLFPDAEMNVVPQLSIHLETPPLAENSSDGLFDVLVTETFGTMLLGESALAFVSDARNLAALGSRFLNIEAARMISCARKYGSYPHEYEPQIYGIMFDRDPYPVRV